MTTTPEQIDRWRKVVSEHQRLEFKEAKNQYDNKKLFRYCVAIANEGGGHLLLGIENKPPRKIVGTQAFRDPIEMASKILSTINFRVDIEEVSHPDGRVLIFHIPSRPQGTAYHYDGTYLMRSGEELVPMSEDRLRKIFTEGKDDFENQIAKTNCTEEEVAQLLDMQSYYDLKQRPFPSTRQKAIDVFIKKDFVRKSNGSYSITNMGALLFAKKLEEFPELQRKAVRVIVYDGNSKSKIKDGKDKVGHKGYAAGFISLLEYIYDQLPASEEIETALRTTTHVYPHKAIRELVGNAIVHQDLSERGTGVTVEIFDDRIEITNPGIPLLDIDHFIDENQSRNEKFANTLRQLRICEERGHGIDEVVTHVELYQLPPYQYRLGSRHTTMILSRYKPLKKLTSEERIHAVYQHCVLRFITNRITNNESIRDRFKIDKKNAAQATRLINEAVAAGKIRASDPNAPNKIMRYIPYWS